MFEVTIYKRFEGNDRNTVSKKEKKQRRNKQQRQRSREKEKGNRWLTFRTVVTTSLWFHGISSRCWLSIRTQIDRDRSLFAETSLTFFERVRLIRPFITLDIWMLASPQCPSTIEMEFSSGFFDFVRLLVWFVQQTSEQQTAYLYANLYFRGRDEGNRN